jgi:hypothetical protein
MIWPEEVELYSPSHPGLLSGKDINGAKIWKLSLPTASPLDPRLAVFGLSFG